MDSGGAVYNPNGGSSGGSSGSSGSSGSGGNTDTFTAQDLLNLSNAGDDTSIVRLVSGGGTSPNTKTVTMSAADLGLPADGSVTLTILGIGYSATAGANPDGTVTFEVPLIETGTTVTIELTVQDAGGTILWYGSSTQSVEDNIDISLVRQFWTLPASILVTASPSAIEYDSANPDGSSASFSVSIPGLNSAPAGAVFTYSWKDQDGNTVAGATGSTLTLTAGQMLGAGFTPLNASETRTYTVEVTYTEPSGEQAVRTGSATVTIATEATLVLARQDGSSLQTESGSQILVLKKSDAAVPLTANVICYGGTVTYSWTPPSDPAFGAVSGSGSNNETGSISPTAGGQYTLTVTATLGDGRVLTKDIDVYVLDLTLSKGGSLLEASDSVFITDATGDTPSAALTAALDGLAGLSGVSYSWQVGNTAYATVSPASGTAAATATVTGVAAGTTSVQVTASYKGVTTTPVSHPLYVAGIVFTTFPKSYKLGSVAGNTISLEAEVQGYSGSVIWGTWGSGTTTVASVGGGTNTATTSSTNFTASAGGKTEITLSANVGGVALTAKKEIYVLDLTLSCPGDASFSPPTAAANGSLTLASGDTAGSTVTANLAGLPSAGVSYTWTPPSSTVLSLTTSGTGNKNARLAPLTSASGTETVSVTAAYDGESITKSINVTVAKITLSGPGTFVFNSDPAAPAGANDIALILSSAGVLLEDLSDISYESSNTLVAANPTATTIGNASGTVLKGGLTTITVRATAGGKELTATTDITVINLIVKDGADHDVPATGSISLADGPVTLSAEFEGLTEGTGFSWACTPASGADISINTTSGPATTVSGTFGTATVTLTATYGGSSYTKDIGFDVIYVYTGSMGLEEFLQGITGTDPAHPAKVNITGLTADNWTAIRTAVYACSSVYVDLSATVLPDGINMAHGFKYCENLVVPPAIPDGVTDMSYCFDGCTSLTSVTVNASITSSFKWDYAFFGVTGVTVQVPDCDTKDAIEIRPENGGATVVVADGRSCP